MNEIEFRTSFSLLLQGAGITQAKAAALICVQTQRPCSVRAVRSWLSDPMKPSSRPCPLWALEALQAALMRQIP